VQQETDVRQGRPDPAAEQLPPADWAAADEMRRRTFTVVEQGYDQAEVRGYLTHLAEVFAHQASQLSELRQAADEAPVPAAHNVAEDPSGLATKIADVLKEAEEHAARMREEAEGEAKLLLAGAQQRADQSEREAEQRLEQRVAAAEEQARQAGGQAEAVVREADQKVAQAEAIRAAVLAELRGAFDRISELAGPEQLSAPVVTAPANPAPPA
jgi:DivIVA protein